MTEMTLAPPVRSGAAAARWRWLVPLVLLVAIVVAFFDRISIAVLFTNPDFQAAMGTGYNPPLLGMLMTAFLIPYALSAFLFSFTGDVFGPRRALAIGAAVWGALMLAMGAAASYAAMIVFRVLLGVTEGPQWSWVLKVIKRWFPEHEQARANSIWLIGSPLGSAAGFPLAFWFVTLFGWRGSFYTLGALNILVVVPLILAVIRDWPPQAKLEAHAPERAAPRNYWADCGLFLRNYRFWLIVVFDCGPVLWIWGVNSWLPTYLKVARHFDTRQVAFFSSLPFVLTLLGVFGGAVISDRIGRRAILCVLGLFGAGVFVYLGSSAPNAYVAELMISLSALCIGLQMASLFTLLLQVVPQSVTSGSAGVMNGIANSVGALAPLVMGWLIGVTSNFNAGLMFIVLGCCICACAMLPLVKDY